MAMPTRSDSGAQTSAERFSSSRAKVMANDLLDGHDHAPVAEPLGDAHALLAGDLPAQRAERAEDPPGGVVAEGGRVVREPGEVDEDERARHSHVGNDTPDPQRIVRVFTRMSPSRHRWVGRPNGPGSQLPFVHGSSVHVLALGRHPEGVRARRRWALRRADRRPALPRRRQRGAAPADAAGHAGSQRRARAGPARADGQAPPGAPGATRPRRPRRGLQGDRRRARRHRRRGAPRHREQRARRRAQRRRAPRRERPQHRRGPQLPPRHAARRPRRQGARAGVLRLRVRRGPPALRAADGQAPAAAHAADGRPDVVGACRT